MGCPKCVPDGDGYGENKRVRAVRLKEVRV
jgi:hypothetical protein